LTGLSAVLSVTFVIGLSDYFAFGFTTLLIENRSLVEGVGGLDCISNINFNLILFS